MTLTATAQDFKVGNTLITSEGHEFTITDFYGNGMWNARSRSGSKVVFEDEARFYKIKVAA